ncbi:Flavin-dependent oxidoreductase, luciferase family (includes alkanesulfonate monooxygenase SsuD and methylene tetrahydromethanopterin reductase) [Mycobacterium rhizamassiliense]|jgi:probable F420-dependent oxidoreductase|uniref:Flavin-dependent oxidoreductase, luciferase family (Includes alkanesulfonate monooxygenase SsuD and methylene tetrahydromethanopterin reductase) n=1 Tax=Mycobacterium rhizamassiliense TaxID=1841860 RepID=A0A2U3NVF2_9MYCO|nr:TIGR03619 family F420-dependent LLM class oxidoreductase [Mycobacterium rhizamassiliense]SPM35462.1 Flavin-dependent oxidoreductase, luciferase family (includes alkanesulfonate monooxygenase SsuD and methylene tetrahydromethanopterin reductase) [Mycobacterium rhizamassiliense]
MASIQLSMGIPSFSAEAPPSWDHLTDWAQLLERCGFDRVLVSEHIAFGMNMDAYANPATGGTEGGRQPTGPDGHWLEPLTVLTFLAARTDRIRLGTNILLAALRPAAVLAKTVATLDVLSGGRVDLGVGVGWQREEYEAAGVDFDGRGALLDETLEVCQRLWRENEVSHSSARLSFDRIHQMPKPAQPGGVPIWVSGTVNRRVARRLARFGSCWIPWGADARDIAGGIGRMRAEVERAGGDPDGFGVSGALRVKAGADGRPDLASVATAAAAQAKAGVTDLRVTYWPLAAENRERDLRAFVEAVQSAVGG